MRFFADQDVYEATVRRLLTLKHDVLRARDVGLSRADDDELLRHAHAEGRILLNQAIAVEMDATLVEESIEQRAQSSAPSA